MSRGYRFDLDPQVPSLPLRELVAEQTASPYCCSVHTHEGVCVGTNAFADTLSERWGVTLRTAHRWLRELRTRPTISLYIADEMCAALHIPFAFVYPYDYEVETA